jgi:hypothetical protein
VTTNTSGKYIENVLPSKAFSFNMAEGKVGGRYVGH